jgi:hypothetical protein
MVLDPQFASSITSSIRNCTDEELFVKRIRRLAVAGIPEVIVTRLHAAVPVPVGRAGIVRAE